MTAAAVLAFLGLLSLSQAGLIQNLPGAPPVSFKQFAGYFNLTGGHHMHYWFVESQNNPLTDPVLIWLTGGPGCSGYSALLTENGPFTVQPDGKTLVVNPYSWNRKASVLTVESPIGVGFSYTDDNKILTDDDKAANDNWEALRSFFTQFPQYKNNDFYITGESYGGIYVPTLADTILKRQNQFKINLKGIAIGNGCVSESLNTDTTVQYAYNHGMIDETTWQRVNGECCEGKIDGCKFSNFDGFNFCASFVQEVISNVWFSGINPYDIYSTCVSDGSATRRLPALPATRAKFDFLFKIKAKKPLSRAATLCLDETRETNYMNQPAVRKALFVPDFLPAWADCSDEVFENYQQIYYEMDTRVQNALGKGVRVLVYNGDTDIVCNFIQGQRFTNQLGLKLTSAKTPFTVNNQIGGFHTAYGLAEFVTVRGAGHMVPTDRPAVAFHMIDAFLKGQRP